jgi:biopolymer transport protein ExbB/TolQ
MRTTIELTSTQRERLLAAAARRGEKGFSKIVGEALDRYFDEEAARLERVERALSTIGSISHEEADRMEADAAAIRSTWR